MPDSVPHRLKYRDILRSLVYGAAVLVLALIIRGVCLAVFAWVEGWAPNYKATWALEALEWVLDVGLVAGVTLLVVGEFSNNLITLGKSIRDALRSER